MKTGYSISSCCRDIATGKVGEADVEKIVAGTRCDSKEIFETVLGQYLETYWKDTPEAANIARRFWDKGMIDQPRVRGEDAPNIANGHWL
jgi:hypothetical protein